MPGVQIRLHKQILWLVLDRPPLNALTFEMLELLTIALRNAPKQNPRLVVITGAGEQAFCTGVELPDNDTEAHRTNLLRVANEVCIAIEALREQHVTLVALVKGSAFAAGCELVALCDVVIARDDARFRLPAVNAKVFIPATTIYLPAAIGQELTTRLMQSGETQNAKEAMRIGLAHQVLPTNRFLIDTEELLTMLATPA